MKKIKWGILGPGIIANQFANDFQFVENAVLLAVASTNAERANTFAQKYNIPNAYASYTEMYNNPDIDAVYIATPHNFHYQMCVDALRAGKAVLCEKPITISPKQLSELVEIANQTQIYLMEGLWSYFLPAIQKAQAWINQGRIGEVLHVQSSLGFPKPFYPEHRLYNPKLAGGVVYDMGVYSVAMAWLFKKQDPRSVSVVAQMAPTGVESDVQMQFKYNNGAAALAASFKCKLHNWTFVMGEKGYIAIPDSWRAYECYLYEGEQMIDHFTDNRKSIGFEYEIRSVSFDLLQNKKESEIMPHLNSMKFQEHMAMVLNEVNK